MGEVTLIRHGQASFGTDDYDRLSPLGHAQAEWLGDYINAQGWQFDHALRGGLRRHRETAEGIVKHLDLPKLQEDPRFDEMHYDPLEQQYVRETGSTASKSRSDFITTFPEVFCGWGEGRLGEGETFASFEGRVLAALDAATQKDRRTLIVTSGGVIGVILRRTMGLSLRATADLLLNIHNASVHRLTLEEGRLRLSLFNASPHLDPEERAHARTYI
ncbi:histidine phosphatase family protein [Actibacterium sp. 188UL27-1]|uniref:histidine phosphatase family protein n=1 Tax=Actibacterium sp. 188UL27-1 TaxID=2786961 RepID=UPI00195ADB6C|nr:histidine phosphatase family protein [Actibacterium sp. 188UL27-1]MBM7069638.1 histidine phosphatase family protein [Actibacterium sp. 188UL27-1]